MIQYQFNSYESIDSTNTEIKRLCHQGAVEGTLVVAKTQTAGRGRLGRRWISPPGNLYFSILLKPKVLLEILSQLSLVAGLALAQTIHSYTKENKEKKGKVTLKWPNDVLLNRQKIAGILVETDIDQCLIEGIPCYLGIGVNMENAPELTAYPATCFKDFLDPFPNTDEFLQSYLKRFNDVYLMWQEQGFSVLKEDWLKFAHGLGQIATAIAGRDGPVCGQFETITDQGGLVLIDEMGKSHIVSSSEVTFPLAEDYLDPFQRH